MHTTTLEDAVNASDLADLPIDADRARALDAADSPTSCTPAIPMIAVIVLVEVLYQWAKGRQRER